MAGGHLSPPPSPATPPPRAAPAPHRAAHEIAADFVHEMRGAPAAAEELRLLVEASDACPEDPDADPIAVAG